MVSWVLSTWIWYLVLTLHHPYVYTWCSICTW